MDVWYELALREMSDVNERATDLRREAERLPPPPGDDADEDDE
jgi:hypothetical protein